MHSFNQNVIKHKLGLLNLAAEMGNVAKACKMMGLSRDTFYSRISRSTRGLAAGYPRARNSRTIRGEP